MLRGLNRNQRNKVQELCAFTGCNQADAARLLAAHAWDTQQAADAFFTGGGAAAAGGGGGGGGGGGRDVAPVDAGALNAWFDSYADPDETDLITEDGIERFCGDVGLDTQDVAVLLLAWKMEAAAMCVFTREEFSRGMTAIGCDSAAKVQAALPALREDVGDDAQFRQFYDFCYSYSREEGQKSLGVEIAVALWRIVMPTDRFPLVTRWCDWLEATQKNTIPRDTWTLALEFFRQVGDDVTAVSDSDAWPVLVDDFVEHLQGSSSS